MTNSVDELLSKIEEYSYNPTAIQRTVLNMAKELSNGELAVVDPTNPFVFCLETSAVLTVGWMNKSEALTRKQYPQSANTMDDLYLHMSDKDYVGRFATPSRTTFSILISKDELLNKLVDVPELGIKKLVIPRNTVFSIAGVDFSLQYPIEIRQMAHGGLQVVYDVDIVSPLQSVVSNYIPWEIRQNQDGEWLFFDVDVQQFNILSRIGSLNAATGFTLDIALDDEFYYARVYLENDDGTWKEIRITHTDEIYDVRVPTAVIRVQDKLATVSIPQIYTTTGVMKSNVRIDIYQTKGPLNMILGNYPFSAFSAKWLAVDKNEETPYSAPIKTFQAVIPFSNQTVTGGSHALDFDTLRERVMDNAIGVSHIPITNVQIESYLETAGYDIVKNVDVLTNRVFLAIRELPAPINASTYSGAAAAIGMLDLVLEDTAQLSGVIDNGNSLTITPKAVFKIVNGKVVHIPQAEINTLMTLSTDDRAVAVNAQDYRYTPFHYVLDASQDEFDLRAYYFDAPAIETKLFVEENDTTLLQVSTDQYAIAKTDAGFVITVSVQSSDAFKELADEQVFAQLGYYPPGERDRAYLMGTMTGKTSENERIFSFTLNSNFNVNAEDALTLQNFFMYTSDVRNNLSALKTDFDLFYATSADLGPQWQTNDLDLALGRFLLPQKIAGISHEKLRVRFGSALDTLWRQARTVVAPEDYRTWDTDVIDTYEKDVYQVDPNTGAIFTLVNGVLQYNLLHHKDDPVLDSNGIPVLKHRAGEVMLDSTGKPILKSARKIGRQIDLCLFDGAYWFATQDSVVGYRAEIAQTVVGWLTMDLENLEEILLEQTRLYFYPKTTIGDIEVIVEDGVLTKIPAEQTFSVTLYVNQDVYLNAALREKLEENTTKVILEELKNTQVSNSRMVSNLRAIYGQDVIDVQLSGLGGAKNYPMLTITDDTARCSLKKKLVAQTNNLLAVEEDITVEFVRHTLL